MKKTVNGKVYDTKKATNIGRIGDCEFYVELYVMNKNRKLFGVMNTVEDSELNGKKYENTVVLRFEEGETKFNEEERVIYLSNEIYKEFNKETAQFDAGIATDKIIEQKILDYSLYYKQCRIAYGYDESAFYSTMEYDLYLGHNGNHEFLDYDSYDTNVFDIEYINKNTVIVFFDEWHRIVRDIYYIHDKSDEVEQTYREVRKKEYFDGKFSSFNKREDYLLNF